MFKRKMNEGLHIREQKSYNHNKKLQQFYNKANLLVKFEKKKNMKLHIMMGHVQEQESKNYFVMR